MHSVKWKKKFWVGLAVAAPLSGLGASVGWAMTESAGNTRLAASELMVVGQDKFLLLFDKPKMEIYTPAQDPIAPTFAQEYKPQIEFTEQEGFFLPLLPEVDLTAIASRLLSPAVTSRISMPPFVTIRHTISFGNLKLIKRWNFTVSNALGQIIFERRIAGREPPPIIVWDGRDENGNLLVAVNRTYLVDFECFDIFNRKFIAQNFTFHIDSLTYESPTARYIELSGDKLFQVGNGTTIAPEGQELVDEALNYFREELPRSLDILVVAKRAAEARQQGELLKNLIRRRLTLPANFVTVKNEPLPTEAQGAGIVLRLNRNE
jgi:hypothetical protein